MNRHPTPVFAGPAPLRNYETVYQNDVAILRPRRQATLLERVSNFLLGEPEPDERVSRSQRRR
jgi:hypothetical protein